MITPTRQDILNLGAIVLLRTLLNYFLEREIQQGEQNRQSYAEQIQRGNHHERVDASQPFASRSPESEQF
ncbi:DUF1622 domain-containing protein [Pantanalinema sp. GBBB05]|uniref:DUF1622 domain-containing protein n=1 Tax=Pantanalinema sp. GBBB05 TaxID=2604139 RepID=UPI003D812AE1